MFELQTLKLIKRCDITGNTTKKLLRRVYVTGIFEIHCGVLNSAFFILLCPCSFIQIMAFFDSIIIMCIKDVFALNGPPKNCHVLLLNLKIMSFLVNYWLRIALIGFLEIIKFSHEKCQPFNISDYFSAEPLNYLT